ncbi:MAG: PstS family phosphate ABC transporter substrate-binding protein, partial [Bacillota bacterium]
VNVTVGFSGTGGGFKKSTAGEIDISNASRPIKEEELAMAEQNGIEFIELQVAIDGLSVVVNPANDFVDYLTVEELKKIWEPNSTVKYWSDVRPEWPQEEIKLYGPGPDSGTFDYFTEAVVGESGASRADYTASEDDNVLVTGVAGDKYSLGYFGYAYYEANKDKIKAVPIDGGNGPVEPTVENINQGAYTPLSRPVYIYVNKEYYDTRPELQTFVQYYMDIVNDIAQEVGFVPLPEDVLAEQKAKL